MRKDTKFIAVISGKGGVGKTTISINLASALMGAGRRVVVVDADLHTPNVGLQLGAPLLPKTSYDAIVGEASLCDVSYRHSSGLQLIPSKLYAMDLSERHFHDFAERFCDLHKTAEVVLVDMPSGLNHDLEVLLESCDYSLIVTTPDFPSVTNALKAIRLSADLNKQILGVVVNMVEKDKFEMSKEEIEGVLGQPVLVSIPDEGSVRESIYLKNPVVCSHPQSVPAVRFKELARSLIA